LERINQLTILRESNATLRAECDRHEKRSREFETRLHQLTTELDPAKEQLRGAQAELEARDVQIQRLQQESAMWQERNRQLLSKVGSLL
jgi:nucleoprotein TPR